MAIETINNGESGSVVRGKINGNFAQVVPSRAVASESSTIDCSAGSLISMSITANTTFSFSNLEGAGVRTVEITGDYDIDFNPSYSVHFQSTLSKRIGDVRMFTVVNYGTTASPLYVIKDTIGGEVAIPLLLTPYGEDATTGTKARVAVPYNMFITDFFVKTDVAPAGSTLTVDVNKDATSMLTNKITVDIGDTTNRGATTPFSFVSDALRTLNKEEYIGIDLDSVGSSTAAQGVQIIIYGYRLGVL